MAQDVPAGVVAAFKKGNSQELNGYLSDKVELILESRSINVDNRNVSEKEKLYVEEKKLIGMKAASLITPKDSILIAFIQKKNRKHKHKI